MEIKLNSKLLQAANGLMLFAIAIILMACDIMKLYDLNWLVGLFLLFGAAALGFGWFLDKKDCRLATVACFYALFAIIFFANHASVAPLFLAALAMVDAGVVIADSFKLKEENANLWFLPACLAALVVVLGFISCLVYKELFFKETLVGVAFLFLALAHIAPFCLGFLPKIEIKK